MNAKITAAITVCTLAFVGACDRVPSEGRILWSPKDHGGEVRGSGQGQRTTAPLDPPSNEATTAIGDTVWANQCANCHGPAGGGNGPMGPSSGARDLSNDDYQSRTSPGIIAATIKNGKGRMPKFDLPDEVIVALVQKVQSFGSRK
jgi:mono/diheme cytochrome c family protein